MSDRTRVSTPKSVKKQQQRARRDKQADAAIMAGLEQEREMIRLQKDATKSANLARARRAQEVTQVGPPVAQPNFDDTGMQSGLPFDESSIRQSPSDPSTPNNYEAPPPFPLTPSVFRPFDHSTDFLQRLADEVQFSPEAQGFALDRDDPVPPLEWRELDQSTRADSAAEVLHGAAYDAVGSSDVGVSASIGLDPDLVLHMDDFTESLRNIQEILLSQNKTEPTAESRRKATEMLRSSPGVIALIRAGDYKFEDFTTDGAIDIAKLTAARADLQKRIESSDESYALAAKARGYTPSGAAYPITGVNNIVAGNRRVPNSNFVMYHGPQYSNG